jgi:hypothetical protein
MDNGAIIGLVGLITAVFTGLGLLLKHIKHSECMRGCCEIDTRTPPESPVIQPPPAPPPTPQAHHRKRHNAESEDTEDKHEDKKSEFNLDIIDSSV